MEKEMNNSNLVVKTLKPSNAFIGISWAALILGVITYITGLWNADPTKMLLNEKGYYFSLLMFGLFASVSLQKTVRDKEEGIPLTGVYYGLCWLSVIIVVSLMTIGLWRAGITNSEKGFYAMSFIMSLFSAVAVQKNVRDVKILDKEEVQV